MDTKIRPLALLCLRAFALFFLFSACVERIDINTEASPPRLVIYGFITTDTAQHAIRITRSTGYFVTEKPEGIPQATVSIGYDDKTIELKESPMEPGLYLTSSHIFGIPGKTYTLHASLDFNGDGDLEDYEATSFLPFPATLDSAAVTPSTLVNDFLQVVIWGNLPEESSNSFGLHLYHNNVLMNDSLQGFRIFQDDFVVNKKLIALPAFQLDPEDEDEKLTSGDILTVQIGSFTTEYADFIGNAQQEMRGPVPLFGGPPANIETNIRCISPGFQPEISGFFTAYSLDRVSTVYVGIR